MVQEQENVREDRTDMKNPWLRHSDACDVLPWKFRVSGSLRELVDLSRVLPMECY